MAVQDILRKVGGWSIQLKEDAPPGVLGSLDFFGHIAVVPGRLNPVERGDEMLTLARYVGIFRDIKVGTSATLTGVGLASWLGDEDGKGDVLEYPGVTVTGATFAATIAALAPSSLPIGTIYSGVSGTLTNTFSYMSRRTAIDYVCDTMGGEWRVRNDGYLDAGPASTLFTTTPTAMIVRKGAGYDIGLKALPGDLETTRSVKDFTTRVVLVAQALAGGTADLPTIPYKDMHGNDVALTRIVDETDDTTSSNATARAQAVLNLWSGVRRALALSVDEFDVAGDFTPGDVVWCYDPDSGIADTSYEVEFRGRLINPMPVRVREMTWPVTEGHTVGFRNGDGTWVDLTPYVAWESQGGAQVVVSDSLSAALTPSVGSIGTVPIGGSGDTAVPGVPTFGTFTTTSYQPGDGLAQAAIKVVWTQPLNTDSSTITDGDHYEVRYRPTGTTDWQVAYAGFDQTSLTLVALSPATTYEFQIRAVDYASPINYGAWSATTSFLSATDTTPPATPAPPTVAASKAAVQVTHTLGLASGGTYNLPLDMDHLDVHVGTSAGFTPSNASLVGKLTANAGLILGAIPAVGTFPVDSIVAAGATAYVKVIAVDKTGNASTASSAASSTALLWDSAYISDLTVSKVTAGTLSATVLLSGLIRTATSGARVEIDSAGVRLYNSSGVTTVDLNTSTGTATLTGKVQTGVSGSRVIMDPATTDIQFFPSSGSAVAKVAGVGVDFDGFGPASTLAWLDSRSSPGTSGSYSNALLSSYTSGAFRAKAIMTCRQSSGITSSYVALYDAASDSSKIAAIGVGYEGSGSVQGEFKVTGTILTASTNGQVLLNINSVNTGLYGQTGSNVFFGSSGAATLIAVGSANASVQNGSGSYYSANGSSSYIMGPTNVNIAAGTRIDMDATTIYLGQPSGNIVRSDATYNNTATFAANVGIATSPIGVLYRLTSSARYKVDIMDAGLDLTEVLALRPVTYYDRGQWETNGESTDGLSQQVGLIAEEVAALPGLGQVLAELDEDGRPESVNYERVGVVVLDLVKDIHRRLLILEGAA